MSITHATLEDARRVAEIHVEAWRAAYAGIVPAAVLASLSVDKREAVWCKCIAQGKPELLVVRVDGDVAGWLSFGRCRDDGSADTQAEVWAIYVRPAAWSSGAGRSLWLRARELMLAQGFESCSLWVLAQNERAIRFYGAAGFLHDGALPKLLELGGAQLQEIRMISRLAG
jgi:L-amino acid N-acyltransferase YncA